MVSLASTFGRRFWLLVAVLPALALSAMSDFFTVHSSCNTGDVNNLLDDAVDLLDRTLEALTVLKSTGGFFSAGSEKRNYMRNMHDTYGTSYYNIFSKSLSDVDMAVVDGRMGKPFLRASWWRLFVRFLRMLIFSERRAYFQPGIRKYGTRSPRGTRAR